MKFKVVNFRADRISGWCQPPNKETDKARIDLLLGGHVVDSFLARNFRSELPAQDFADRNLGFLGSLPPQYWGGQPHHAALRERATGAVLAEETLQPDDARIPGHPGLSATATLGSAGQLNGWASYQGNKVPVHMIIDSHTVSTAVADLRQLPQDKKQPKVTAPVGWAFSLQVPPEYFDGADHRIQITVDTEAGSAIIFDQTQRLSARKAGAADQNFQQTAAHHRDSFPLPGLRAPAEWPNRWKVNAPTSVTTRLDDAGQLRLTTTEDTPVYLLLNALPQDFRKLDISSGAQAGEFCAYRAELSATQGRGMQLQLGVYEYDSMGHNTERTLVEAGQRGLFVTSRQTDRILVLIRAVGPGTITIEGLELLPADDVRSADPGFHPIGDPRPPASSSRREALDEIADFLGENQELYHRLAEASAEHLTPVLNELLATQQQMRSITAGLTARGEELSRQLAGIRTHLAQQHLADTFDTNDAVEILAPPVSPAGEPTGGPNQ